MDFFSKVKRAFGFPDDDSDYGEELRANVHTTPYVNPFRRDNDSLPAQESVQPATSHPAATEADVAALKAQMQQLLAMMRNMQRSAQQNGVQQQEPATNAAIEGDDNELRQRLQQSETQRRAAQNRANSLSEKIEDLQVKVNTLENDKKGLLNKIRVMQVRAGGDGGTDTTDAIEKMMEQHHEDLAEKDQQIAELKQQLEQIQKQVDASKEQAEAVAAMERQLAEAKEQLQAATSEATMAKEQAKQHADRIKELEDELHEANENLEIAAQVQQKLEDLEQFKNKKNAEITHLKAQVEQLSHDQDYKPKFEQAEQENADLRKTIDQLNALAKDTAEKHKRRDIDVANHIDALKAQLASAATVVERHRAERDLLDQQMSKLKAETARTQEALRAKEDELAETSASLTVANAQIEQLRNELDQLRSDDPISSPSKLEEVPEERGRVSVSPSKQEQPEEIAISPSNIEQVEESVAIDGANSSKNHFAVIEQDLDDIDWLMPAVPDKPVITEPEPEPEPEPMFTADPRQLSLF